AIQAYNEQSIQINFIQYEGSLIVSREEIISDLAIKKIEDMDESYLELLMHSKPEVIIIGHEKPGALPKPNILNACWKKGVGLECMSIGAACRTFNVLLGENRAVVAGFIKQ